jgi:hypothetical protein
LFPLGDAAPRWNARAETRQQFICAGRETG